MGHEKDGKVLVLPKAATDDIYEAKILDRKMDTKSNEAQYKIHYKGWNKRWDEWVSCRRLLQINSSNIQFMKDKKARSAAAKKHAESQHLEQENGNGSNEKKKKRKLKTSSKENKSNNNNKRRKLNNDDDDDLEEKESINSDSMPLEIKLPTILKRKLISDWEQITKKSQLIELPRNSGYRSSDILTDFESFAIRKGQNKNIVIEISRGIKDYFNQALQVTLLYKLERKQYQQIIAKHNHLSMDQIYGVEHLCRLFVKLPQLLSPNDLDGDTRKILKQQIEFMIDFILSAQQKYFENASYKPSLS